MKIHLLFVSVVFIFLACDQTDDYADAHGNFEAGSTIISSEAGGKLIYFNVKEGEQLEEGKLIGLVDTSLLDLQRKQLDVTIKTIPRKLRNTDADVEVLENKKSIMEYERERVARLLAKEVATQKQLDDINGQIDVLEKQILAVKAQTRNTNNSILSEQSPLIAQKDVINEQIRKCYIHNPLSGRVLTKMAEQHEIVGPGSPLYRIAKLDTLELRFYVDAVQLQSLALGKEIEVLIDQGKDAFETLKGSVFWIAEQAEFTPKTIQTKEDRVNLVYAVKAYVPNPDNDLKIGMPADVNFMEKEEPES